MKALKKSIVASAIAGALILGTASTAVRADLESHDKAHVYVNVVSNISVQTLTSNVGLGDIQTGLINGSLAFSVNANMEAVSISASATSLYKGNDATNTEVAPIALNAEAGATYIAPNANPLQGGSNSASCAENGTIPAPNGDGDMTLFECDTISFESSQDGYFSQDVMVELQWHQDDPEKTTGQYSGYVFFWASVLDGGGGGNGGDPNPGGGQPPG